MLSKVKSCAIQGIDAYIVEVETHMEGNIVYSSIGESGLGMQKFHWDGLGRDGNPLPEGPYRLEILAENTAREPVTVTSFIKDIISSIDTQGVEPIYTVGAVPVGAKGILALYNN